MADLATDAKETADMADLATDDLMPAYASLQVDVYLNASDTLDGDTARHAAQFLCPTWTPQKHLDYGIAQHAIALGLQPGADQDACTAAAFMHCAAGGLALSPGKVPSLNKALKLVKPATLPKVKQAKAEPLMPATLPKIKEAKAAHATVMSGSLELARAHQGLVEHHLAQAKIALQAGDHAAAKVHLRHVDTHTAGMEAAGKLHNEARNVKFVPQVKKAMDPRALRPRQSRRPTQIGTTRSGKKIFDVYAHPAHASFTAADHRDMIAAAAASYKPKTAK